MTKRFKPTTPILALILFIFAVGYSLAEKVVVIPMGEADSSAEILALTSRVAALENDIDGIKSKLIALTNEDNKIAQRVTTLETKQYIPSELVSAFSGDTCPSGWQEYTQLNSGNRFIRGASSTFLGLGATGGNPLHFHQWSTFEGSSKTWVTGNNAGELSRTMMVWGDGIGVDGTGVYPIAPNGGGETQFQQRYYTDEAGGLPPFKFMLFCEKV